MYETVFLSQNRLVHDTSRTSTVESCLFALCLKLSIIIYEFINELINFCHSSIIVRTNKTRFWWQTCSILSVLYNEINTIDINDIYCKS